MVINPGVDKLLKTSKPGLWTLKSLTTSSDSEKQSYKAVDDNEGFVSLLKYYY